MSDIWRDYSFGGQLRTIRHRRKETLRQFSLRIGIDCGNYSKLENGRLSPPSTYTKCKKLLDQLEVGKEQASFLLGLAYEHHLGVMRERWSE